MAFHYQEGEFSKRRRDDAVDTYDGPRIPEAALREVEVWAQLLPPLFQGIQKPHSVIYEIKKLEKLEREKGVDYSDIKDTLRRCCPPDTTVNDSIEFKDLRDAIIERIIDITGISGYMKTRDG